MRTPQADVPVCVQFIFPEHEKLRYGGETLLTGAYDVRDRDKGAYTAEACAAVRHT